jgi:hypothetical protein
MGVAVLSVALSVWGIRLVVASSAVTVFMNLYPMSCGMIEWLIVIGPSAWIFPIVLINVWAISQVPFVESFSLMRGSITGGLVLEPFPTCVLPSVNQFIELREWVGLVNFVWIVRICVFINDVVLSGFIAVGVIIGPVVMVVVPPVVRVPMSATLQSPHVIIVPPPLGSLGVLFPAITELISIGGVSSLGIVIGPVKSEAKNGKGAIALSVVKLWNVFVVSACLRIWVIRKVSHLKSIDVIPIDLGIIYCMTFPLQKGLGVTG